MQTGWYVDTCLIKCWDKKSVSSTENAVGETPVKGKIKILSSASFEQDHHHQSEQYAFFFSFFKLVEFVD